MDKLKSFYNKGIEDYNREIKKKKRKELIMGIMKLKFLGLLVWFLYVDRIETAIVMAIHVIVVIRVHERVIKERKTFEARKRVNQNELKAIEYQFPYDTDGSLYTDQDHPYSSDLDIFGYHSLFHFINRGNTKSGMDTLAEWLKRSTTGKDIYRRQESIRELAEKSEFRQSVMIQADLRKRGKAASEEDLDNLLSHEPFVSNSPFLKSVIHIVPLMTIGAFAAIFAGVNYLWFLGLIVLQMLINMHYSSGVKEFFEKTGKVVSGISIYTGIIDISEKESFNSDLLKNIRERFIGESGNAGKKISKLSGYIDNLELRRSTLHGLVNNILFWDLNNIFRSEKWLEQSGGQITDWLKACGEIESLSSLATFSFNTPSATFPSVSEKRYHYRAKEMGHPLLKQEERVCNDFNMENEGRVMVITGPNMAGKSTFLRTVGINAILAMAGSVVTAENLELSIMDIHSSMKISDSLDKGISLFYAELRRLKDITDASKSGAPVLFLIDEMLKGTNVIDRRKGSLALMNQLLDLKVSGIIATHDLTLAEVKDSRVINTHFDSIVKGEELEFDYKLKDGICKSFNALVLMKKIGIPVSET